MIKVNKMLALCAATAALSIFSFGCSGNTSNVSSTIDRVESTVASAAAATPQIIAEKLKAAVTMTDMQPLTETDLTAMYGISMDDVLAFAGEIDATGLRTDEFLIIQAKDSTAADNVLTKMKAHQTQRMNEAKNYNPQGYATVQKSPVAKKGTYVYLFFFEEADEMVKILNENVA